MKVICERDDAATLAALVGRAVSLGDWFDEAAEYVSTAADEYADTLWLDEDGICTGDLDERPEDAIGGW